jgi:hypothetical protein
VTQNSLDIHGCSFSAVFFVVWNGFNPFPQYDVIENCHPVSIIRVAVGKPSSGNLR